MADMAKVTNKLKMTAEFVDGDTRTITLDSPNDSITAEQIDALDPLFTKCLLGDKTGAGFYRIKYAATVSETRVDLDMVP